MKFHLYSPEQLIDEFEAWRPLIVQAVESMGDGYSLGGVLKDICDRVFHPLMVMENDETPIGVMLLHTTRRHAQQSLWISGFAGRDLNRWVDQGQATVASIAQALGCDRIEACARPGFERYLPEQMREKRAYYVWRLDGADQRDEAA